jgi:hypothetical protein
VDEDALAYWRHYFGKTEGVTDEEMRALDEVAAPYDDHDAFDMLAAYRLGRTHEREAQCEERRAQD